MTGYDELITEQFNSQSREIDKMSPLEIVTLINQEDHRVPSAIKEVLPEIAEAVDRITERIRSGGRLIYIGAGTSGRLGIIDAAECPPTYGVSPDLIKGIIAGGKEAVFTAAEGAEDDGAAAVSDLKALSFCQKDVCFAISASGSPSYCCEALRYASSLGALTITLSCNKKAKTANLSDIAILPEVGPEVISGSTRMKAGSAQKMVLTMISTAVMVRLGRVSGGCMVYMKPSNKKLRVRALKMIRDKTGASQQIAQEALDKANENISEAIRRLKKTER